MSTDRRIVQRLSARTVALLDQLDAAIANLHDVEIPRLKRERADLAHGLRRLLVEQRRADRYAAAVARLQNAGDRALEGEPIQSHVQPEDLDLRVDPR